MGKTAGPIALLPQPEAPAPCPPAKPPAAALNAVLAGLSEPPSAVIPRANTRLALLVLLALFCVSSVRRHVRAREAFRKRMRTAGVDIPRRRPQRSHQAESRCQVRAYCSATALRRPSARGRYEIAELTPNVVYRFRVRCFNKDGIFSAWSAITPAVCTKTIAPAAPLRPFLMARQECAGAGAGAEPKVAGTAIGWALTKNWSKFGPIEGFEIESRLLNPKRAAESKGAWKTVHPLHCTALQPRRLRFTVAIMRTGACASSACGSEGLAVLYGMACAGYVTLMARYYSFRSRQHR